MINPGLRVESGVQNGKNQVRSMGVASIPVMSASTVCAPVLGIGATTYNGLDADGVGIREWSASHSSCVIADADSAINAMVVNATQPLQSSLL